MMEARLIRKDYERLDLDADHNKVLGYNGWWMVTVLYWLERYVTV